MRRSRTRDGFTLIEVVVTVTIMGLVTAVLAAVFSVIVRNTPTQAERVDDARSLLGLTTWIPRDVGSTAEAGFRRGDFPSPCSGVPASQGLLELQWSSNLFPTGDVYTANYRFVDDDPTTGTIVRYACVNGGPASSIKMTAPLQRLTGAQTESPAPVNITLEPATSGNPGHRGLEFEVIVLDDDGVTQRELISLDAFTANVITTLPPMSTTTTTTTTTTTLPNQAPSAYDLWVSVDPDVPLTVTVPADDPEAGALIVSSVTPPAGGEIVITNVGVSLDITITASLANGATPGSTYTFTYVVDDAEPLTSNAATVTVTVNNPSGPTTTSTTSTTTTTTLPPACVAAFAPGNETSPTSIELKNNGTLQNHLTVNITTNSYCIPLVVTFDPMPNDTNMTPESLAFGAATSVTIDKNAHNWDPNETSFTLTLREGANGTIHDTHSVGVSP